MFIFAHEFKVNVCVHYDLPGDTRIFCHVLVANATETIHLNLTGRHFTPYLRVNAPKAAAKPAKPRRERSPSSESENERNKSPAFGLRKRFKNKAPRTVAPSNTDNNYMTSDIGNQLAAGVGNISPPELHEPAAEPIAIDPPLHSQATLPGSEQNSGNDAMQLGSSQPHSSAAAPINMCSASTDNEASTDGERTAAVIKSALDDDKLRRYLTAKARPPREKPPWAIPEDQEPPAFNHLRSYDEHPF